MSNGRMKMCDELGKIQKEYFMAYLKVLCQHFPEGTEENNDHFRQIIWPPN
jgi:hypothetical protein